MESSCLILLVAGKILFPERGRRFWQEWSASAKKLWTKQLTKFATVTNQAWSLTMPSKFFTLRCFPGSSLSQRWKTSRKYSIKLVGWKILDPFWILSMTSQIIIWQIELTSWIWFSTAKLRATLDPHLEAAVVKSRRVERKILNLTNGNLTRTMIQTYL